MTDEASAGAPYACTSMHDCSMCISTGDSGVGVSFVSMDKVYEWVQEGAPDYQVSFVHALVYIVLFGVVWMCAARAIRAYCQRKAKIE